MAGRQASFSCSADAAVASFSGRVASSSASHGEPTLQRRGRRRGVSFAQAPGKLGFRLQASSGEAGGELARQQPEPFAQAAVRLQTLLSNVKGDGEAELIDHMLTEEPPEAKVSLALIAGGAIATGACVICWACGKDPFGGASFSVHSLVAGLVGAAAATPLMAAKYLSWTDAARKAYPPLVDLQKEQIEYFGPLLKNMTKTQVALVMACDVLPVLMMALPAAQGALGLSFAMYADNLRELGIWVPHLAPMVCAVAATAGLAALGSSLGTGVSAEEYEAVLTALQNSDRYYRVMATSATARLEDAKRYEDAFKYVAMAWLARQQVVGRLAGVKTAFEVLFWAVLWQQTGDLTAPAMAALLTTAVDFHFVSNSTNIERKRRSESQ